MKAIRHIPLRPVLISLLGLAFCLWIHLSGGKELCLTDGCSLFQDFRLAGVSLWSAGAAFFAVQISLCLLSFGRVALFFAGAALIADILLLSVMALTAPCVNCLVVGFLIALNFAALLKTAAFPRRTSRSPLLLTWGMLFILAGGGVLRDLPPLWSPLPHGEQTSVQVFFSPSCRACQTLTEQADRLPDAAWFPVAEDSRDIWLIHAMERYLAQGVPLHTAVAKARADLPSFADVPDLMTLPEYRFGLLKPDMLLLQFRLWRNRAHVLSAGSDRLPFVEFRGLPSFLREGAAPNGEGPRPSNALSGITDLTVDAFCSDKKDAKDCEADRPDARFASPDTGPIDTSGMLH